MLGVMGSGFGGQSSGRGVWGSGFGVQVSGFGFRVEGSVFVGFMLAGRGGADLNLQYTGRAFHPRQLPLAASARGEEGALGRPAW